MDNAQATDEEIRAQWVESTKDFTDQKARLEKAREALKTLKAHGKEPAQYYGQVRMHEAEVRSAESDLDSVRRSLEDKFDHAIRRSPHRMAPA